MTKSKRNLALLAMCLASSLALGQNADKNSSGPTRNDYRLRVVEPLEGSIIAGTTVRVTVTLEIAGHPAVERKNSDSMPQPEVAVFLDNERKGDLKNLENVLTLDNVAPGRHQVVLLATNQSGEIIDRQVIGFESTPANGSAVAAVTGPAVTSANPQPIPAVDRSSDARRDTGLQTVSMPKSEPAAKSPAPMPIAEKSTTKSHSLPKTGTGYPAAAAAGLTLVLTGLVLRRRD